MKFHAKMNYKQIRKQTVNDSLEGEKQLKELSRSYGVGHKSNAAKLKFAQKHFIVRYKKNDEG